MPDDLGMLNNYAQQSISLFLQLAFVITLYVHPQSEYARR